MVPVLATVAGSVTIEGLPNAGRCYFTLNAGAQDEWLFDFTSVTGGRALPGAVRNLAVVPSPMPPAPTFTSTDIGAVSIAGSTSLAGGVYTIRASGADIWGAADEFRFVYRPLTGDGEITARVDSLAQSVPWTKAGVMIRESLATNSRFAMTMVTGSNGVDFEARTTTGGQVGPAGQADGVTRAPHWVRLRRLGNVFTAFVSADGVTWVQRGAPMTISMPTALVGLAVTSSNDAQLATAVFSSVTVQ